MFQAFKNRLFCFVHSLDGSQLHCYSLFTKWKGNEYFKVRKTEAFESSSRTGLMLCFYGPTIRTRHSLSALVVHRQNKLTIRKKACCSLLLIGAWSLCCSACPDPISAYHVSKNPLYLMYRLKLPFFRLGFKSFFRDRFKKLSRFLSSSSSARPTNASRV